MVGIQARLMETRRSASWETTSIVVEWINDPQKPAKRPSLIYLSPASREISFSFSTKYLDSVILVQLPKNDPIREIPAIKSFSQQSLC